MRALCCTEKPPPPPSTSSLPRAKAQSQTPSRTLIPKKTNKPRGEKLHANPKGFAPTPKEPSRRSDKPIGSDPDDPPIPEEVFHKMMVRIVVSVGTPLAVGVAILKILGAMKDRNVWDVPMWVPFSTTLVTFGASALGIAYGSLSTSLDPNRKGSLLGLDEAKENWVEMWKQD
ncbi:PREDICTED: uncharacterized protein PAM68-like [Tarenaya hassleriana]|uniref:uncharacterized protein PAM68-like n=1 Tax=Tarenaya hassleriana TaxID=28532 RepID=UPI00053C3C43|nr:PREDICTED: uncharacterized protein PAM68-like [Tarenaya hassleriana]